MVHVATKLRNLLLSDGVLYMGNYVVSITHVIILIEEVGKDRHHLTLGDIDGNDRMNFRLMEKMYFRRLCPLGMGKSIV